ncbi:creatininase [Devosia yakushimensis]|uniref:Creatininase n=1 Tax=Devosia yakushimensis TaxID=470028 RepID=A0ABQ5UDJ5_9HYPH|nr:creatininase family protein [Devosia yakushimensis]GLQ08621.1 creatininase [Devosia yakushimensis]
MATHFAEQLTAPEFARFAGPQTIAVLPVAAIEPHGPHLPLSTDCDIARGHLSRLAAYVSPERDVLVLPLQAIGHSLEHSGFAGVFTHNAETLLRAWTDVVDAVVTAGVRRLIVVSSHGGNSEVVGLLATRLRAERDMLAVNAAWLRFGQPEGLFDADELEHGIHGGDVETSLMLHYRPEAVRGGHLADFASAAMEWDAGTAWLKTHGRTRPGWLSRDLNPQGAMGNALLASAEKGAASAEHALTGFAQLIDEVAAFDLGRLE